MSASDGRSACLTTYIDAEPITRAFVLEFPTLSAAALCFGPVPLLCCVGTGVRCGRVREKTGRSAKTILEIHRRIHQIMCSFGAKDSNLVYMCFSHCGFSENGCFHGDFDIQNLCFFCGRPRDERRDGLGALGPYPPYHSSPGPRRCDERAERLQPRRGWCSPEDAATRAAARARCANELRTSSAAAHGRSAAPFERRTQRENAAERERNRERERARARERAETEGVSGQ